MRSIHQSHPFPAPAPTQADVEAFVERASERILRFLKRRGVITLVTAPGDGGVTVVTDETMGEATSGAPPAGPTNKRKPVRIVLDRVWGARCGVVT
jgi:hypothetical protein